VKIAVKFCSAQVWLIRDAQVILYYDAGPPGNMGDIGSTGVMGINGNRGIPGVPGYRGPIGVPGSFDFDIKLLQIRNCNCANFH